MSRSDPRASQLALADSLSLDPSNVVGLLNELEERQLITRRRESGDRRRHIVEISRRGEEDLCSAHERLQLVDDDLLKPLSAQERATLYALLVRAVGAKTPPCGFDAVDAGPLEAGRTLEPDGPVFGVSYSADELSNLLLPTASSA